MREFKGLAGLAAAAVLGFGFATTAQVASRGSPAPRPPSATVYQSAFATNPVQVHPLLPVLGPNQANNLSVSFPLNHVSVNVLCGTAVSSVRPTAGSTVSLQRGCTYSGSLTVNADNVTVTAYGSGPKPVITSGNNGATVVVYGSGDMIENLSLRGIASATWTCGAVATPAGNVDGVDIKTGAMNNTVSNIDATSFYAGVYIMAGSNGNTVESSTFDRNLELDVNNHTSSAGAFGVLIWGDNNVIQYNSINNNQACSLAYGHDGSAVEIYGGSNNWIRRNNAANNAAFTELGRYSGHTATGNNIDGNTVTDGASHQGVTFLITRGSGDPNGPVQNTQAAGNIVTLTQKGDIGTVSYDWRPGDGTLLTLTGNSLNLGKNRVLYEDGGYTNGGGNTFTGTCNHAADC